MEMLFSHDYPGNVRELENIIERAVLLESGDMISTESLPPTLQSVHRAKSGAHVIVDVDSLTLPPEGLELFLEGIERRLLKESLRQSGGVRKEAAKLLKLSSRSFRYRVAKLNLQMPGD
jgi:two-component system response regulator PilR (NtrC family)